MRKLVLRNSEGKIIKEMPFDKNQTNEEWRKTCSTEEFIKWIVGICNLAVLESTYDVAQLRKKRYWEIWLEEEHVEGVGDSNNDDA